MTTPPISSAAPSFTRTYRDAPMMWVLDTRVRILADSAATSGRYSMVEVYAPPSIDGPPPHIHDDADELFHVLEGGMKVLIENDWRIARAGDTIIVPRGLLHTFSNPFLSSCRFLAHYSPAGFERFFVDAGIPVERSADSKAHHLDPIRPPVVEPPSLAHLKAMSIKHHMRIPGVTDA